MLMKRNLNKGLNMDTETKQNEVVINEKSMEILVAKFIPTSQYFERSFEMLQRQLEDNKLEQREFKIAIDKRFEQVDEKISLFQKDVDNRFKQVDEKISLFQQDVDNRFKQVDKRFEQVDKRFEQIDKRFEQVDKRFDQIDKRFEQVDKRFEKVDQKFEKVNESINNLALQIEKLAKSQETTIRDYIIERDRHYDAKFNSMRNYNLAIISVVAGVILKMAGIIHL